MRRPELGPDAGDPAVSDDDLRRFDPLGEDVDDLPAGQEQVGGLQAPGHADAPLEQVQVARGGGMVGWWMRLRVAVHGGSPIRSLGPQQLAPGPPSEGCGALGPGAARPRPRVGSCRSRFASAGRRAARGGASRQGGDCRDWCGRSYHTPPGGVVHSGQDGRESRQVGTRPAATSSGADNSDMDVVSHPLEPGRCAECLISRLYVRSDPGRIAASRAARGAEGRPAAGDRGVPPPVRGPSRDRGGA